MNYSNRMRMMSPKQRIDPEALFRDQDYVPGVLMDVAEIVMC